MKENIKSYCLKVHTQNETLPLRKSRQRDQRILSKLPKVDAEAYTSTSPVIWNTVSLLYYETLIIGSIPA